MEQIIPIQSWNPVWKCNAVKADTEALMPSFMFRPNIQLLDLIQQGALPNNAIEIDITGTNSLYDGIHKVIIDRSSMVGGDRPNYFATTNIYIATLYQKNWFSYPPVNGVFKVRTGVLDSYKTDPVPEERMVQIVSPKPEVVEKFQAPPPSDTDSLPYLPLRTEPSVGAVAAGVYDSTVNAALSYGVPVSYMYNEYRVPPSAITKSSDSVVENYCGCNAKFAPYVQSSRNYDQESSIENFEMTKTSKMGDTTTIFALLLSIVAIGIFYAVLRRSE